MESKLETFVAAPIESTTLNQVEVAEATTPELIQQYNDQLELACWRVIPFGIRETQMLPMEDGTRYPFIHMVIDPVAVVGKDGQSEVYSIVGRVRMVHAVRADGIPVSYPYNGGMILKKAMPILDASGTPTGETKMVPVLKTTSTAITNSMRFAEDANGMVADSETKDQWIDIIQRIGNVARSTPKSVGPKGQVLITTRHVVVDTIEDI